MDQNHGLAKYYPKLDTVRAFAVSLVLFHHFFNQRITALVGSGNLGVDIFFTLSGFLITGVLISYRSNNSFWKAIRKFYYRRFLRIFPIYYLYIFIIYLIFRHQLPLTLILYAVFYGMNFYVIHFGWDKFNFQHFWSLAVEEQFYLVWPFLILLLPFKTLRSLIILIILISIGFAFWNIDVPFVSYMHPLSCMQALAIGALTKYISISNYSSVFTLKMKTYKLLILSLIFWAGSLILFDLGNSSFFVLLRTFSAVATAFLILCIVLESYPAWLEKILNNKFLQFIGKISYGIYVYHILIQALLDPILSKFVNNHTTAQNLFRYNIYVITFPLYTAITILTAWASFRFIETPINRLKN